MRNNASKWICLNWQAVEPDVLCAVGLSGPKTSHKFVDAFYHLSPTLPFPSPSPSDYWAPHNPTVVAATNYGRYKSGYKNRTTRGPK